MDALEIAGIHVFTGTQILDFEILLGQYRKGLDIARRAAAILKGPLSTRSISAAASGFPTLPMRGALTMKSCVKAWTALVATIRGPGFSGTRFLVEPGRYLVGEAGVYMTRITDVKISRGKKFFIVDGGMNHQLAASGNLGQTIKRNYPVAVLNKLGCPAAKPPTSLVRFVLPSTCWRVESTCRMLRSGIWSAFFSPGPMPVLLARLVSSAIRRRRKSGPITENIV